MTRSTGRPNQTDTNPIRPRNILLMWIAALFPLTAGLNSFPAQRTQEARVLETAREMLGKGAQAWLIPYMNGELRLRKPPLPYWLAGAAFKALGVSEWAGRLPTLFIAWLTLGVAYAIGRHWFGVRAGIISAACLLSSSLFFRFERLAETDAPAALFVTIAVYAFWRSFERRCVAGWLYLAAIGMGLAFFSKGPPGLFPLLFFVIHCCTQKRGDVLLRFITSGAIAAMIVLSGAWYAYAAWIQGVSQFAHELKGVSQGADHYQWFTVYLAWVPMAMLPWTLLGIGAALEAARRFREPNVAGLLAWGTSILLPLCVIGNKQIHYLLPLMPCLAVAVGWYGNEGIARLNGERFVRLFQRFLAITAIGAMVAPLAFPIAGWIVRGHFAGIDFVMLALTLPVAWIPFALLRGGRELLAIQIMALLASTTLMLGFGPWALSVNYADIRESGQEIRDRFGNASFVFYGGDTSLPLCFAMRQEIRRIDDAPSLVSAARANRDLVVIWEIPDRKGATPLPPDSFVQAGPDVGARGQHFRLFTYQPLLSGATSE